jgi:murein DD-endopeptidase MepM/ murein hydrolase activator NlpD
LPPSRTPRHAAPAPSRRRTTALPAVLLLSVGMALGGLAVLPHGGHVPVEITAAAATSPVLIDDHATIVSNRRDLSLLDGPTPTPRAPARASRSRRVAPVKHVPEYVRPGVGVLTSGFKWRWGRMHTGIDLAGPYGSAVFAVTNAEVIEADQESGYGNIVKLRHADGTVTYYAHLSRILVTVGEHVTAGEQIAKEGDTGHSTGPHLHFEVRINDVPINPIPWLAKHGIKI